MGRKRKPLIQDLEITDFASEGKSLGKYEDKVVFVPEAVPGDVLDVQIKRKRKSFMEGVTVKIKKSSPLRVAPFCEHFSLCGGCKWQHVSYEQQLAFKEKQVLDNLTRIGKLSNFECLPIKGCKNTLSYRNKMEYTFSNKRWLTENEIKSDAEIERNALGLHIPGLFNKIVDINHCHLQSDTGNLIRNFIRTITLNKFPYFDIMEQHGFMRNVMIRNNRKGEYMVVVVFYENQKEDIVKIMEAIKNEFPEIVSLNYIVNQKQNDSLFDQEVMLFHGEPVILEYIEDFKFIISPKSFFQTNPEQTEVLYNVVKDFAAISKTDIVYDLYCGTGTIGIFLSKKAQKIVGVEIIEDAISDARYNVKQNNLSNAEFFCGDAKDVVNDKFIAVHGQPDVIVLDPPRAGLHASLIDTILNTKSKKIVYVSCNPATQARDLAELSSLYEVVKTQPVDMFPHTHHVENVALLEIKK